MPQQKNYHTLNGSMMHPTKDVDGKAKPLGSFANAEELQAAYLLMLKKKIRYLLIHLDTAIGQVYNVDLVYELIKPEEGLLYKGREVDEIIAQLESDAKENQLEIENFHYQLTINCSKDKGNDVVFWSAIFDYCIWPEEWLAEDEEKPETVWHYSLGNFSKPFEVELMVLDHHIFHDDVILDLNWCYELTYGRSLL